MPSARAAAGVLCKTGRPSTVSVPESGFSAPVMTLISVDFPAPFSPSSACTSPEPSENETPRRACTPAKDLVIAVASSSAIQTSIAGQARGAQEIRRTRGSLAGAPCSQPPRRLPAPCHRHGVTGTNGGADPRGRGRRPRRPAAVARRFDPSSERRDEGVPRGPGAPPHQTPWSIRDATISLYEENRTDPAWPGLHRRGANDGKPGNLRRRRRRGRALAQR